ncbi:hypothetical protein NE857_26845 [Nocardiopsis exhalans]|uniref:Uncharacterized protein n=1 Tax=Nocardiopsis exhalans TaxID=163604 RepID=A0ABY5D545_9ACTN|nr:hypothetical protein [Nocardiopsis exhalans]USY18861.1 hypothetical protein NE857_26845 [Nocardiopsis exhalans]
MTPDNEHLRAQLSDARDAIGHLQEIITELVGQARENGHMTEADAERWDREVHAAVFRDAELLADGGDAIFEAEQHLRALRSGDDD